MQRFTLEYTYADGGSQRLFNLSSEGCQSIERAQAHLGSHSFKRTAQDHNYSQMEIELIRMEAL